MPRADAPGSDVDRPSAILAVTVLGVVGSIVFLLLPLLVGAFSENLAFDTRQVGYLGSADMVGMFIAAAVATLWVRRSNWQIMAALASALLFFCHVLSGFLDSLMPLLLVRCAAGFAGGSLMSIALTSLGDTRHPDRYFALFISGQLSLGAIGLWRLPDLIAEYGLRGIFIALAIVTALAALTIPFIPRRGRWIESTANGATAEVRSIMPGVMALLGCLVFNTGIMAVWAYMERMGNAAGLEPSVIGGALGASLLAGLVGALVAAVFGDRFGRMLPIAASAGIQLIALFLISGHPSTTAYATGVMLFSFGWNFPVAYQLAITVSVDSSGRLVVVFLSAVKLGYAIGPVVAAQVIALTGGFGAVMIVGAVCFILSGIVYVPLAGLAARHRAIP